MLEWRWWGVRCRLSLLFPAAAVVLLTLDDSGLTALCLLASCLHELGHFALMLVCRDTPAAVTVGAFGIRVERGHGHTPGYGALCAIALAGPGINVLCGLVLYAAGCPQAAVIHAGLAAFNLLPITSLDGGEALYYALCCRLPEQRAERVCLWVSVAALLPLAVLGFVLLFASGYNFTLLLMCGYLALRIFLVVKH